MLNRLLSAALTIACTLLAIALMRLRIPQKIGPSVIPAPATAARPVAAEDMALLNRHIHRVHLDHVTLEDAIRILSEQTHVNICADRRSLERAGLSRIQRFSLHLNDVTLEKALSATLGDFDASSLHPCWLVCDGVITLTISENARDYTRTECFNIRGMIEELRPGFHPFKSDIYAKIGQPITEDIADSIIRFITGTIDPETWRDNGGTSGSISEISGILIVTQTAENLAAVAQALHQIHESVFTVEFPLFTKALAPTTLPGGESASTERITQYVNLRSLIEKIEKEKAWPGFSGSARGVLAEDIISQVVRLLTETIDPDSWQDNGGKIGSIYVFGPIIAITQTPANIRAARLTLDNLFHATSANDFLSATRPSEATTRESVPK